MSAKQNLLNQLADLFDAHSKTRIPVSSPSDEAVNDARADLIYYDSYVAGYVTSVLNGSSINPEQLQIDTALEEQLAQLKDMKPQEEKERISHYQTYKHKLDDMLSIARRISEM